MTPGELAKPYQIPMLIEYNFREHNNYEITAYFRRNADIPEQKLEWGKYLLVINVL
jgi:hypothetical protein